MSRLQINKLKITHNNHEGTDNKIGYAQTSRVGGVIIEPRGPSHPIATSRRGEIDTPITVIGNYTAGVVPSRPIAGAPKTSATNGSKLNQVPGHRRVVKKKKEGINTPYHRYSLKSSLEIYIYDVACS